MVGPISAVRTHLTPS
jgi:hypothetical protein